MPALQTPAPRKQEPTLTYTFECPHCGRTVYNRVSRCPFCKKEITSEQLEKAVARAVTVGFFLAALLWVAPVAAEILDLTTTSGLTAVDSTTVTLHEVFIDGALSNMTIQQVGIKPGLRIVDVSDPTPGECAMLPDPGECPPAEECPTCEICPPTNECPTCETCPPVEECPAPADTLCPTGAYEDVELPTLTSYTFTTTGDGILRGSQTTDFTLIDGGVASYTLFGTSDGCGNIIFTATEAIDSFGLFCGTLNWTLAAASCGNCTTLVGSFVNTCTGGVSSPDTLTKTTAPQNTVSQDEEVVREKMFRLLRAMEG